jgi:hypothetical protein
MTRSRTTSSGVVLHASAVSDNQRVVSGENFTHNVSRSSIGEAGRRGKVTAIRIRASDKKQAIPLRAGDMA